jgi:putative transposase
MRRAYKFRLRPTARQHVALAAMMVDHRDLYNMALRWRRTSWEDCQTPVRYGHQSAALKDLRAQHPAHDRWSFSSQQATLRRLDKAFSAFYRRCQSGDKPGYPRFKPEHRFNSVEWPSDGDGCRWLSDGKRVRLKGVGHVKVSAHRKVEGRVKTVTVKREGRRWFLVLSCDEVPLKPLEPTGAVVGVDVGLASFTTTSDGQHIANPRYGRVGAQRLSKAQVSLARKQRGSTNRRVAREVVANRHRKVANQRRDFHHKTARRLVEDYDVIAIEALRIINMTRSASGTVDAPGTNVAAKSGLNRSILDAGWAQFVSILRGKAEEAGRAVIDVDPRHTSQRCYECDHVARENRVTQAAFRCQACGHEAHADENAACNILRAGLALLAAQAA